MCNRLATLLLEVVHELVLFTLRWLVTLAQFPRVHDWFFRLRWDLWSLDSIDIDGLLDWLVEDYDFSFTKLFLSWWSYLRLLTNGLLFQWASLFHPATWLILTPCTRINWTRSVIRLNSVKLRMQPRFQTTLNHWSFHLRLWNVKIGGTLILNCLRIDLHHVDVLACDLVKLLWAQNLTTFLSSVVIDSATARIELFRSKLIVVLVL